MYTWPTPRIGGFVWSTPWPRRSQRWGTGEAGDSGDGGPVTEAMLRPWRVALDGAGNVYASEYWDHRIRRIDASTKVVATLAGTGRRGFGGDGGPAAEALLASPAGVALDSAGNAYVADSGNHRIRRIDAATGVITTVAGTGEQGYGGDGGPASEAMLAVPRGVALDTAGHVYVADSGNSRVRRVDASTGVITAFAGTGDPSSGWEGGPADQARLVAPRLLAVDGANSVFFSDSNRIWKLDPSGMAALLAGTGDEGFGGDGGPASEALLNRPQAVCADLAGNLYVADTWNHRIRRVNASTGVITTLAGTGDFGYGGDGATASRSPACIPGRGGGGFGGQRVCQ